MKNTNSNRVILNIVKSIVLALITYIIFSVSQISFKVIETLIYERKISLMKYIWLTPIDLRNNFIIDFKMSWSENFIFLGYLLLAAFLISILIISTILYKIGQVLLNVWKAEDIQNILESIQSGLCWLMAYLTVGSINNIWPIEVFLDIKILSILEINTLHLEVIMKLMYVWVAIYFFKSFYQFLYLQMLKMPSYFKSKAFGE